MIKVFYIKCSGLFDSLSDIVSLLCLSEQERLGTIKNDNLRLTSAVSRVLVLKKLGLLLNNDINYSDLGKPFVEGYNFSISHTDDIVCVAVSDSDVGIDIEKERNNTDKISDRYFDESEKEYQRNSPNGFTRVWTLKEAVIKLFGKGLSMDISSFCVYPFDTEHLINGKYVSFYCNKIYGLPVSVASFVNNETVSFTEILPEEFKKEIFNEIH